MHLQAIIESFDEEGIQYDSQELLSDIKQELKHIQNRGVLPPRPFANVDEFKSRVEAQISELDGIRVALDLETKLSLRIQSFGQDLIYKYELIRLVSFTLLNVSGLTVEVF